METVMKNLATIAVLAFSIAVPAVAQTQLERSVGAAPGQYTLNQLVELKARQDDSGLEAVAQFEANTINFSASNRHNPVATRIFQQFADESRGDGS